MNIAATIDEVAAIAATLEDSPLYFKNKQVAQAICAMLQAATAFHAANDGERRLDAALWVGEAYLLFSSALPDTGSREPGTLWASAKQISMLLGGPDAWENRVRAEFT